MITCSRPTDIYGGPVGGDDYDPWKRVAEDIVIAAIQAVKAGELGAEAFFFSRYGENIIAGLGSDPEFIRLLLQREYTMSRTTLDKVAEDLKRRAMESPRNPVRAPLNGALSMVMLYELTHWRLSMTRPQMPPTKAEVELMRHHFRIPADAKPERITQEKNGVTWHVLRFHWPSSVQLNFVEENGKVLAFTERESYYDEAA